MTDLNVPFAHTIEPNSLEFLIDEVGLEEFNKKRMQLNMLASFAHPNGGGASYYVVFLDPNHKTLDIIMNAEALYDTYETTFYNEEIHLLGPK